MATVLSNVYAAFTFDVDGTTGLKLVSFARAGGTTWTNNETALWKAKVFDTTSATPWSTAALTPTIATLGAIAVVADATGSQFTATWTDLVVGGDRLTVRCVFRLNNTEDFLRSTISASWKAGVATYALDSIGILPLAMSPLNNPNDFMVLPNVFGIQSQDPITHLKYATSPNTTFGQITTNTWCYPTGRGYSMGVWGYYETTSNEAWMIHVEDWSDEVFSVRIESDGTNLVWEPYQPQEDNILVGNNSRELGSGYTFCLRPLLCTQINGWWDMGAFYRSRVELLRPDWYVPTRDKRTDLTDAEKKPYLFMDLNMNQNAPKVGDGTLNNLAPYIEAIRSGSGASTAAPVLGVFEGGAYHLANSGEDATGDAYTALTDLYLNHGCYFGVYDQGLQGPLFWSIYRWDKTAAGDHAELRWWTDTDVPGVLRMSRTGRLGGGGSDRLLEIAGTFYRERTYPITLWTSSTKTLTVTGSPSGDGFSGTTKAVLIPASSSARLASATVQTLGASTIKVTANFTDGTGATVTPDATYQVAVYQTFQSDDGSNDCWHAAMNSSEFLNRNVINAVAGANKAFHSAGKYFDEHTDALISQPTDGAGGNRFGCYRDHSTWSKIDPGYTRHPYGGGDWYVTARRAYHAAIRAGGRAAQQASSFAPFFTMSCEDIDEVTMGSMDYCWHTISSGELWRAVHGVAPTTHKYSTIPLMSVVHSGRTMGRALNQEFSSALMETASPFNDPNLHKTQAYFLGYEWPYGMTQPTLSLYQDDTHSLKNLFDDTKFVSGGGSVANLVKSVRQFWQQIVSAESWLLPAGYLRYGQMMAPGVIDGANTDTTAGLADSTYTTYYRYDVIYPRATTPRVIHVPWKASDKSVAVVCSNWSDTSGKLTVTLDTRTMGLGAPGSSKLASMTVTMVDASQAPLTAFSFDATTAKLTVTSVAALSVAVVIFTPLVDTGTIAGDPAGSVCSANGVS